jgi:hypothetical protein
MVRVMTSAMVALPLLAVSWPAHAVPHLAAARALPPQATLRSEKALFDVERCIVEHTKIQVPDVYRTPDRPAESVLVSKNSGMNTFSIIELSRASEATLIVLKGPKPYIAQADLSACLGVDVPDGIAR